MVGYGIAPLIKFGQIVGKKVEVHLSNGRTYRSGDGHLDYLNEDFCVVDGRTNFARLALPVPTSNPGQENASVPSLTASVGSVEAAGGDSGGSGSAIYVIPHHENSMAHPSVRSAVSGVGGNFGVQNYSPSY